MSDSQKFTVMEMSKKLRSKLDLYNVLSNQRKIFLPEDSFDIEQFLLPAYKKCPVAFMKDLLKGNKKVAHDIN